MIDPIEARMPRTVTPLHQGYIDELEGDGTVAIGELPQKPNTAGNDSQTGSTATSAHRIKSASLRIDTDLMVGLVIRSIIIGFFGFYAGQFLETILLLAGFIACSYTGRCFITQGRHENAEGHTHDAQESLRAGSRWQNGGTAWVVAVAILFMLARTQGIYVPR
jgi:hypothetical protein